MPHPTLEVIKTALFSLMNKDAESPSEKSLNNLVLDTFNECQKLIAAINLEKLAK